MKIFRTILIFISFYLSLGFLNDLVSQTLPSILIDGQPVQANSANFPYWLKAGQTLAPGNKVISISVLQYNISPSPAGGNSLQFESVENVSSLQTVPANKAWKIEAVALDLTASSFVGDNLGNHVATTDLNMNNYKIWNLAPPNSLTDAINVQSAQKGGLIYATDVGTVNNYVVNLSPAPTAYNTGMIVNFIAANGNTTGTATLNVNGLGAVPIKKQVNNNLITGDILAGQAVSVIYDGNNFQMLSQLGTIATGGGGIKGMQIFNTSTSWTVPSGVTAVIAEAWGGGGGGGGGGAYNINSGGGGGGGGSGAYGKMAITGLLPGASIPIVVGTGGTGGAAGAQGITAPDGVAGGNSSVNGVIIAYGGAPGKGGGSGGNGYNGSVGSGGSGGGINSLAFGVTGNSGSSGTIGGTGPAGTAVNYFQMLNLGAGGTGGKGGTSSSPATAGSNGSSGLIIIYY